MNTAVDINPHCELRSKDRVAGLRSSEEGLGLNVVLHVGLLNSTQEKILFVIFYFEESQTQKMGSVRVSHMPLTCAPVGREMKTM